ncbi:MAG: transposase [Planctomycetia bacterium]|nr:transposase [Planctomycetia bacterium]
MARGARHTPGGFAYHVLNRAVARLPLFEKPADYDAFLRVLHEALAQVPMRVLALVLMPNHWHCVLWPHGDGDLSALCRWLAHTHSMRWHAHYHTSGTGHIYQGRFKAFAVEGDDHLYAVCRYVERNPLRANLVARAEHWRWGSLWRRVHGDDQPGPLLSPWPVPLPATWVEHVHAAQTEAELAALRRSVRRGCPFGTADWQQQTAVRLGLAHTLRPLGRPKKAATEPPPTASPE